MTGPRLSNPDTARAASTGPHIFFRPISDHVDAVVLGTPNTSVAYTVPANAKYLVLSATADFYVKLGESAVEPTTNVVDGSAPELNPVGYAVFGGEVINFVSTVVNKITISIYSKSGT